MGDLGLPLVSWTVPKSLVFLILVPPATDTVSPPKPSVLTFSFLGFILQDIKPIEYLG